MRTKHAIYRADAPDGTPTLLFTHHDRALALALAEYLARNAECDASKGMVARPARGGTAWQALRPGRGGKWEVASRLWVQAMPPAQQLADLARQPPRRHGRQPRQ